MADIKINKEILTQLTGSIDKSKFEGKKKLLSLFDLIDHCTKNNKSPLNFRRNERGRRNST